MGIPSYFSHIVRMYPSIIQKYTKDILKINNLYLDCNSIIYDVYNKLEPHNYNSNINNTIINRVVSKIEEYISVISPNGTVYIAFDGVAPVAKMEQQRSRRYKSWYQNEMTKSILKKTTPDPWNSAAITPGTTFMQQLNNEIRLHFMKLNHAEHRNENQTFHSVIVSGSDEVGEGEHKIFEYIRSRCHSEETTAIYGLDADLIMLCLNHIPHCSNLHLFRETPHFVQSINSSLEPNEHYLLDIKELSYAIVKYMTNDANLSGDEYNLKVFDYVFLGFLLGNDFLPHFPALNIRTGGIDKILNVYKEVIGSKSICLTDGNKIYWENVIKIIHKLALSEEEFIIKEHLSRNNKERHQMSANTPEEALKKFEVKPMYNRNVEKYINPVKPYWQRRYYSALFDINNDVNEEKVKEVCINYLEGLEWNMKYYNKGCPDWRWCYKYNYPPLLSDLMHYIPIGDTTFMEEKTKNPVTELVQLCYVLPRKSLDLLPDKFRMELLKKHDDWYMNDCEFTWAYCKYFWESHVNMCEIDIVELEKFVRENPL